VSPGTAAGGKGSTEVLRTTTTAESADQAIPNDASAAPSRGPRHTNACAANYTMLLLGIGSGHRQLIAVTCIAEHA